VTLDEFFAGHEDSRQIFDALRTAVEAIGPAELRVTKSQVAFRRRRGFGWAWIPDKTLRGAHAPLVLTVSLRRRDPSPRWKETVEPYPERYTHHLELHAPEDLDDEVCGWLREAWDLAS
jgi:hypothetical protein